MAYIKQITNENVENNSSQEMSEEEFEKLTTSKKKSDNFQIREGSMIHKILTVMSLSDGVFPMSLVKQFGEDKINSVYFAISSYSGENENKKYFEITEKKIGKVLRIKNVKTNSRKYGPWLWDGAIEELEDRDKREDEAHLERKYGLAELATMFIQSERVTITPDKYKEVLEGKPLDETSPALPLFGRKKFFKNYLYAYDNDINARYFKLDGILLAQTGIFSVYNFGDRALREITIKENKLTDRLETLKRTLMPWAEFKQPRINQIMNSRMDHLTDFVDRACILYSKNYYSYINYFRSADKKNTRKSDRSLHRLSDIYNQVYALPLGREGLMITEMMTYPRWHYYLTRRLGDQNRITDGERFTVNIDAYLEGKYQNVVAFVDCDLKKLGTVLPHMEKLFSAQGTNDDAKIKKEFSVLCYDFQVDMLLDLLPPNCRLVKWDLEETYKEFLKIIQ